MSHDENAELSYPAGDDGSAAHELESAFSEAERQLMPRAGVHGLGISTTSSGEGAIVVYVEDQEALRQLPATVRGVPIVGEITGEIRAF